MSAFAAGAGSGVLRRSVRSGESSPVRRLPLAVMLTVLLGLVLPCAAYFALANAGLNIAGAMYAVVAASLLLTAGLITAEGVLALRTVRPVGEPLSYPTAAAIMLATLPYDTEAVVLSMESILGSSYPERMQVVVAYRLAENATVSRRLQDLDDQEPDLTLVRVDLGHTDDEAIETAVRATEAELVGVFTPGVQPEHDAFTQAWKWLYHGAEVAVAEDLAWDPSQSWATRLAAVDAVAPGASATDVDLFQDRTSYWRHGTLLRELVSGAPHAHGFTSLLGEYTVVTDPALITRVWTPRGYPALWRRLVAVGRSWYSAPRPSLWASLRSPQLSSAARLQLIHALVWRDISAWLALQVFALGIFWVVWYHGAQRVLPVVLLLALLALSAAPASAVFAYALSPPDVRRNRGWFVTYLLASMSFHTTARHLAVCTAQSSHLVGGESHHALADETRYDDYYITDEITRDGEAADDDGEDARAPLPFPILAAQPSDAPAGNDEPELYDDLPAIGAAGGQQWEEDDQYDAEDAAWQQASGSRFGRAFGKVRSLVRSDVSIRIALPPEEAEEESDQAWERDRPSDSLATHSTASDELPSSGVPASRFEPSTPREEAGRVLTTVEDEVPHLPALAEEEPSDNTVMAATADEREAGSDELEPAAVVFAPGGDPTGDGAELSGEPEAFAAPEDDVTEAQPAALTPVATAAPESVAGHETASPAPEPEESVAAGPSPGEAPAIEVPSAEAAPLAIVPPLEDEPAGDDADSLREPEPAEDDAGFPREPFPDEPEREPAAAALLATPEPTRMLSDDAVLADDVPSEAEPVESSVDTSAASAPPQQEAEAVRAPAEDAPAHQAVLLPPAQTSTEAPAVPAIAARAPDGAASPVLPPAVPFVPVRPTPPAPPGAEAASTIPDRADGPAVPPVADPISTDTIGVHTMESQESAAVRPIRMPVTDQRPAEARTNGTGQRARATEIATQLSDLVQDMARQLDEFEAERTQLLERIRVMDEDARSRDGFRRTLQEVCGASTPPETMRSIQELIGQLVQNPDIRVLSQVSEQAAAIARAMNDYSWLRRIVEEG